VDNFCVYPLDIIYATVDSTYIREARKGNEMTKQTAAEQRKSLVERFEKMTGETVPAYATNMDIVAWIRDELNERARDAQRREHARQVLAS
jgi:hypothetical protein